MMRIAVASIATDTNILATTAAHGLTTGWAVGLIVSRTSKLAAGAMPLSSPQVTDRGVYFARNITASTLSLHLTSAAAVAGTDPIDFTGQTLNGSVLSLFRLSVRERIERRAQAIIGAIPTVSGCQRWSSQGNTLSTAGETDAMIVVYDETFEDEPIGNPGQTNKTMSLQLFVSIRQSEADPENTSSYLTRMAADVEAAITADPKLTEGTTPLASDLTVTGIERPPLDEEQPEIMVRVGVEVKYCHPRNDPYSLTWPET